MNIKSFLSSALLWTMLTGSLAQAQSWPNNEPPGMTTILAVNGSSKNFGSGWGQSAKWQDNSRVTIVSDLQSKYGQAIEKRFFVGDTSGWHGLTHNNNFIDHRHVYFRLVWKLSDNWQFHSPGGFDKLWYWGRSVSNASPTQFFVLQSAGSVRLVNQAGSTAGDPAFHGSFSANTLPGISRGSYHTLEVLHVLNTPGNADGSFRMWLDGVEEHSWNKLGDSTMNDVDLATVGAEWVNSAWNPMRFSGGEFFLYWGGQGGTKSVNDWIRISEFYVSGSGGGGGTAPAAPSNLAATAASSSQINLSWTDNSSNETGFKIERKTGAGGTYTEIATTGANTTSFNNTGLSASTTYYYRVRSYNGSGNSAYSNEANATTQAGGGGGSIAFRAASSGGTGSGAGVTSATLNKPAGVVSGDVMLAAINLGASATVTAPAGWTLVRTINDTMQLRIYRKTAGSSEPASYTWTLSLGRRFVGGIVAFSGVNATTPIQVENGAAHTTTASTTHTTPSITTSGSGTWLVSVFGDKTTGGSTWTPPSGTTERVDVRNTTGTSADQSLEINTVGPVAAGSKTHTAVASKSSALAGMAIIALQP